jgi:hypothetical protein
MDYHARCKSSPLPKNNGGLKMEYNIEWDLTKQSDLELLLYRGKTNEIKNEAWKLLKEKIGDKIENYRHVDTTEEISEENWEFIKKGSVDLKYYSLNGKTHKIRQEANNQLNQSNEILRTIRR